MNQETQKQFAIKLLLISGVGCLVWNFMVKPAIERVAQQERVVESHNDQIAAYKKHVDQNEAESSLQTASQLKAILESMTSAIVARDSDTSLHSILNSAAEQSGVSITKIDSVKAGEVKSMAPNSDQWVKGINQTVRIELDGLYGSVMTFIEHIDSNQIPMVFTSLRVVPTGMETVRVNAEINSVMLTSIPETSSNGGLGHE